MSVPIRARNQLRFYQEAKTVVVCCMCLSLNFNLEVVHMILTSFRGVQIFAIFTNESQTVKINTHENLS